MLPFLHTLWQTDSAFPSGSFAFSYGLEGLAALGIVTDRKSLSALVATVLRERWANFDRVALVRAFGSKGDLAAIAGIDSDVEAATFGESMRNGSRRNGTSFLTTMAAVGNEAAITLRGAVRRRECLGHIAVMQGAVWPTLGMDVQLVQLASAYTAVNGIVSAAVRLGVVTAMQAQSVVGDMLPLIGEVVAHDLPADARLASFVPLLDVASARQEQANLRLFAN